MMEGLINPLRVRRVWGKRIKLFSPRQVWQHTCNPGTWEAEAGESSAELVLLQSKLEACLHDVRLGKI